MSALSPFDPSGRPSPMESTTPSMSAIMRAPTPPGSRWALLARRRVTIASSAITRAIVSRFASSASLTVSVIPSSIGRFATSDGRRRGLGVHVASRPASALSTTGSALHSHQRFGNGSEKSRGLVASRRSAEPVESVRDPDQCRLSMSRGQHAQHLHDDDRQRLRQPARWQHRRRTWQARGRA